MSKTQSKLTKDILTVIYTEIRSMLQNQVPEGEVMNRIIADPRFKRRDGKFLKRAQVSTYITKLKAGKLHVTMETKGAPRTLDDDLVNALAAIGQAKLSPAFKKKLMLFVCEQAGV